MNKNYIYKNMVKGNVGERAEVIKDASKTKENEAKIKNDWNQEASKYANIDWSPNHLKVLTAVHTFYNELKNCSDFSGKFVPPSLKTNSLAAAWVKVHGNSRENADLLFNNNCSLRKVSPKEGHSNFTLVLTVFNYLLSCEATGIDFLEKVKMHKATALNNAYLEAYTGKYRIIVCFGGKPYSYIEIKMRG